jgi:hypothetical protein
MQGEHHEQSRVHGDERVRELQHGVAVRSLDELLRAQQ